MHVLVHRDNLWIVYDYVGRGRYYRITIFFFFLSKKKSNLFIHINIITFLLFSHKKFKTFFYFYIILIQTESFIKSYLFFYYFFQSEGEVHGQWIGVGSVIMGQTQSRTQLSSHQKKRKTQIPYYMGLENPTSPFSISVS